MNKEQKRREMQVEEIAKDYYGYSIDSEADCKFVAEEMYNKGHRKLSEDSVVLSREEYEKLRETISDLRYDKFDLKNEISEFNDYDAFFAYSMAVKRLGELEDKIEKGLLVPRYSILQDLEFGWWCVCEVDEQSRIIAQCKTEEEAKRKLEELTNE